jgi:hypothetical protein
MKKTRNSNASGLPVAISQLNARPDTIDFRDKMYVPTLVEVPTSISLDQYRARYGEGAEIAILDQGQEGACTGFGLAAVANFLLSTRRQVPDSAPVSERMLYEMARRYDEWPGEAYSGSSARGAMKGWHKHGVCGRELWPYNVDDTQGTLNQARAHDAARRPLGAYFRVNHRDLVSLHSALAEVGILYATAIVHQGWGSSTRDGVIPFDARSLGGHAFAIVGFDERGFWIQNSWGPAWGKGGFALITYPDWLANGTDVWVARLGAPVEAATAVSGANVVSGQAEGGDPEPADLRPHIISIGNDGALRNSGTYGMTAADLADIFQHDLPRITAGWRKKRLLLYAHGGLVGENSAIQRVAEYRQALIAAEVYPLAFVWKSDFWTTLTNILKDALRRRRPEGLLDAAKDFMLDRLDDTLEALIRAPGKAVWSEMKENATLATTASNGGARLVLEALRRLIATDPKWEIHVASHSAGAVFMAPVIQTLCTRADETLPFDSEAWGLGCGAKTVTCWAPACTMRLFREAYLPQVQSGEVRQFNLFTLTDTAEQDDNCARIYNKSLLYLVAHACENKRRLFFGDGEPLLGMEKFILQDRSFKVNARDVLRNNPSTVRLFGLESATWIRCPNGLPEGSPDASHASQHGAFDDDRATVKATLARILGRKQVQAPMTFQRSASSLRDRRVILAGGR